MTGRVPIDSGAPRHAEGIQLEQTGDISRLVDRRGRTVHTLNVTALALWEMCDGETTAQEMTDAALLLFDADSSTVRNDITTTLQSLTNAGLLRWPTGDPDEQRT